MLIYTFIAELSFIALFIPFINKFGITFVYKLPGPITIQSASFIASTTPGAGLQLDGLIVILFILVSFSDTTSGILDFSDTIC